jgi:tetratricopeptide (TPR) repeat protein
MGQYEEGIAWCEKAVRQEPDSLFARIMMTVVYSYSGRNEEARAEAAEVLRLNPKFSLEKYEKKFSEHMISALRKAGLPNKPSLPLPDKPSIAVLAFDNMSADPEQEYLADGITEHIIFALSKISKLFVIARHSSFTLETIRYCPAFVIHLQGQARQGSANRQGVGRSVCYGR